jgi:hypothetical protein
VRIVGERIGLHVWCHGLRHSSITTALDLAAKHGMGLEKVKTYSRHRAIGTLLTYRDEHDRQGTQRRLSDLVASALHAMTHANADRLEAPAQTPSGLGGRCRDHEALNSHEAVPP